MTKHKYILEPYEGVNTRYSCPVCQLRDKTFSRYIDMESGEHIHPSVGRCNRESKCGYHYTPKQYFQDNNISIDSSQPKVFKPQPINLPPKQVSFVPVEVFKVSLTGYEVNHFSKFLINKFGSEVASALVSRYFIASSNHWNGATLFWQIDSKGKVRTGKIMLYSPVTGKRVKEPFIHIHWVHKALKMHEFELRQCLFGEHLLIDTTKPVAIVESEKTAVIASAYLPQFIWLAAGSLNNLTAEKCSILQGRTVVLFPDLNGFEKWSRKAKELSSRIYGTKFTVSDLLQRKATKAEKKQGLDLADYLIRFDLREFTFQETAESNPTTEEAIEFPETEYSFIRPEQPKHESWDITELENYFTGLTLPIQPIKLNPYSTITQVSSFIEGHLAAVKANNGKRTFLPYLHRLQELKLILTKNLN